MPLYEPTYCKVIRSFRNLILLGFFFKYNLLQHFYAHVGDWQMDTVEGLGLGVSMGVRVVYVFYMYVTCTCTVYKSLSIYI